MTLAFGDYCEVYDGTDNTSKSRTLPCIALHPCNNATGSWEFLNLKTNQRIRRSNWKKTITTELVINILNNLAGQGQTHLEPLQPVAAARQPTTSEAAEKIKPTTEADDDDNVPPLIQQDEEDVSDDEAEEDEEDSDNEEQEEENIPQLSRRSARIAQGVKPPERYALVTKIAMVMRKLEEKRLDDKV